MANLMEKMRRWLGGEGAEDQSNAADPLHVLAEALDQCRQQQMQDAARAAALASQAEQSLQSRKVWIYAIDAATGEARLGDCAQGDLRDALCQEGESLAEALERCSARETAAVTLGEQTRVLRVKAHPWEQNRIYTVVDETQLAALMDAREDARQRDPVTQLYTQAAFSRKAASILKEQPQACAVNLRPRLRTELAGIGPVGTGENFLRAWADVVQGLPCGSFFTREEKNCLCGILYGYDPEQLPGILEQLCRTLQEKTSLMEPVGLDCYGVTLGTARYPEDSRSLEGLLLRSRLAAWLAQEQGREGCCAHPGDEAVPEHLLRGKDAFRKLIAEKQVGFMIQPIVRSSNAKIEGYALSMVSRSPDLPQMEQVAQTAAFLGQTQELERLLWFQGMDWVKEQIKNGRLLYNTKLWIPSFPGTYLPDEDARRFEELSFDHMQHLVLQLESQGEDLLCAGIKSRRFSGWNAMTEVRCTGPDQASRLMLSLVHPELIRVSGSLAEGIADDKKKQSAFKALKTWAKATGCKLLAEGISNSADLRTVVQLGADFLQGDCLGRPDSGPADLPENRIAQIGEAHYGKRG